MKQVTQASAKHPIEASSWLSFLTLYWIQPLIRKGAKVPLEMEDLPNVPEDVQCCVVGEKLQCLWLEESKKHPEKPSFSRVLIKCFYKEWSVACALLLFYCFAQVTTPLVIKALLTSLNEPEKYASNQFLGIESSWGIVGVLIVLLTMSAICVNTGFIYLSYLGTRIRASIMYAVFRKSLRLSPTSTAGSNGELVNLMSNDSERIFMALLMSAMLAIAPLTIVLIMALLIVEVGVAGVAGSILTLFIIPMQAKIGKRIGAEKRKMLGITDSRVNVTSEALSGIEVVKANVWESQVSERVQKQRVREMQRGRNVLFLFTLNNSVLFVAPSLISLVIFVVLAIVNPEQLTMVIVFTVLALLVPLRFPLLILPRALSALAQAVVSANRIERFLSLGELTPPTVSNKLGSVIKISDGTFSWDDTTVVDVPRPVLEDVNLEVKSGEMVAIVGSVGSSKSSLLSAILGEISALKGTVSINLQSRSRRTTKEKQLVNPAVSLVKVDDDDVDNGDDTERREEGIAYVAQEPWIQNATLRENILFQSAETVTSLHNSNLKDFIYSEEVDEELFRLCIEAVELAPDLKILPNGLDTEIGDRGVNLSGGQKARVALGRALYSVLYHDLDLVIMDDCFSALDPHVGLKIFSRLLQLLKGKTRLIVLNSHMHLLEHFDRILVLEEGRIVVDAPRDEAMQNPIVQRVTLSEAKEPDDGEEVGEAVVADAKEAEVVVCVDEQPGETDNASVVSDETDDGVLYKAENRSRGRISVDVYKVWLHSGVGSWKLPTFIALLLLFSGGQLFKVATEYWLAVWSEEGFSTTIGLSVFASLTFMLVLFILVRGLLFMTVAVRAAVNLHNSLIYNILRAPVNLFFDVTPTGQILNRVSNDMDKIDQFLPETCLNFLSNVFQVLSTLVICGVSNYYLLLVMLPVIGLFIYVGVYFARTSRELKRLEGVSRSPLYSNFSETVAGISTVRAFALQNKLNTKNEALVDNNGRAFLLFWMAARWLALRLDMLITVLQSFVCVFAIALKDTLDPNLVALAIVYAMQLSGLLQFTVRLSVETDNAFTAVERLTHYAKHIPQETLPPQHVDEPLYSPTEWPREGSIEFRDVSLRYRPHLPLVMKNVSFKISPGEKVAVCGRTGAGKSTVIKSLFRIVDPLETGQVLIGGVDISKIGLADVRKQLSYIPQAPVLFSGSLRFNIDPWGAYSDCEINLALKKAKLSHLVDRDEGLEMELHDRGSNLSHGERQLVSIARSLLSKKRIIVLDEPTANLNTADDQIIQETLLNEFGSQTTLTIAHRIKTIINSDKILVMGQGRVLEFDTPANLLQDENSEFAALARESNQ